MDLPPGVAAAIEACHSVLQVQFPIRMDDGTYQVSPFPFNASPLELQLDGRFLAPLGEGEETTAADMVSGAPAAHQTIVLVAG